MGAVGRLRRTAQPCPRRNHTRSPPRPERALPEQELFCLRVWASPLPAQCRQEVKSPMVNLDSPEVMRRRHSRGSPTPRHFSVPRTAALGRSCEANRTPGSSSFGWHEFLGLPQSLHCSREHQQESPLLCPLPWRMASWRPGRREEALSSHLGIPHHWLLKTAWTAQGEDPVVQTQGQGSAG